MYLPRYDVDDAQPVDDGIFVLYSDHLAAVEAMRAACIAAVEALEPRLDMEKHNGGYDCCGCTTPAALYVDVLDALREVLP